MQERKEENKEVKAASSEKNILVEMGGSVIQYLRDLSGQTSGEVVNVTGKILLRLLGSFIGPVEMQKDRLELEVLKRGANIRNPPSHQEADAVSLRELVLLWKRCKERRLDGIELLALEILTVAFATTSRVAEIASLEIGDVKADETPISVRAKTFARTCVRHTKHVGDGVGLCPTRILRSGRERAIR